MDRFDSPSWSFIGRVAGKAALLFILFNVIFADLNPMEALGRLSLYNWLLPGRARLPYGEQIEQSYNLSLNNIPAMFASHTISQPKAADEFRIIILGDSGTWGWFLQNDETLSAHLNATNLTHHASRITFYNLGYPIMSLTKDLLILDETMGYEPDLIIWPVTLESFPREKQLVSPIVQNNRERIRPFITQHTLNLNPNDKQFIEPNWWDRTIIGQRRNLANLLRLQTTGFAWATTSLDQAIPANIPLRKTDLEADTSWQGFTENTPFTKDDLAFDVLTAGMTRAGDVPVLLINEPMFISDGQNSDLRYNSFYPIWAYDLYREMLLETAVTHNWHYLDLWDQISPAEFTDTPVHLTAVGTKTMAEQITTEIVKMNFGN
ncbi:MAG: hypothetical protein H6667_20100 [Ardenticatenaceae bacterium]|nr:hypothetical protein [Ardenticatenaceae bacterium]MCB9445992.1 hypothetical protein [Ardenticatenaceae bacterium]